MISTQVDAGHLVANSIILLVLGSPLEMAHGPIVGLAFEAGVVLGCVEIKILRRVLLDGVAMPVPHRSTGPGRPRHRREMISEECTRRTG